MSNQNRFLLPHQSSASSTATASSSQKTSESSSAVGQENEYEVDTDFDSYWEEEARNPHRNRIRIGRQYQATVPPLLKQGEKDQRKLEDLETLSFCPKRSAKVTNAEIDHYFKVAKSLNLFASLVETRSLLGRDVTIADLNRIRQKEGLSLASVIQPPSRQAASSSSSNLFQQPQQTTQTVSLSSSGQQQSSPSNLAQQQQDTSSNNSDKPACSSSSITESQNINQDNVAPNQPLMKALSHFISLHHPCYHDGHCKKLFKDIPLEDEDAPTVSITAGNLRGSPSKEIKSRSRSRSVASKIEEAADNASSEQQAKDQVGGDINNVEQQQQQQQNRSAYEDWTREEVELFSKAIEVCGKNFGSIKKEFLPSKSVRSIVEYYYIGSRDAPDNKGKKSNQSVEAGDSCSSPEKTQANNNGQGGGGSGSAGGDGLHLSGRSAPAANIANLNNQTATSTGRSSASNSNNNSHNNGKNISDAINSEKLVTTPIYNNINMNQTSAKMHSNLKQPNIKLETSNIMTTGSSGSKNNKSKNIDARLSVYNFDDEIKEEASPVRFECPRPGAEVRPLKAKPIMPNNPGEGEAGNSNVGSLKFFMDGQLVLKLNACQEQQEGSDKCHWVQSGEKLPAPSSKQKRYSKRAANDRTMSDLSQNGSQSNSVVSSNHDDDSKNEDLMSADEDSKESANSFSHNNNSNNNHNIVNPRPKSFSASPTPKRARSRTEASISPNQGLQQHQHHHQQQQQQQLAFPHLQQQHPSPLPPQPQLSSPIDYNRLAVSNRMKERGDNNNIQHNNNSLNHPGSPLANQAAAAAAAMPWLQANSLAMAAALLGGLPFSSAASGLVNNSNNNNINNGNPMQQNNNNNNNNNNMTVGRPNLVNMATKPMDLSVEHGPPKPIPAPKPSRSRSKQKN